MLNNGIPVIVVSRRLGHAQPSITLDVYGHLIQSKQQEAAEKMDDPEKKILNAAKRKLARAMNT